MKKTLFQQAAAKHKEIAAEHTKAAKSHAELAAFAKGKHDAMADDDPMKQYVSKQAEVHSADAAASEKLASHHTDLAAHNEAVADSITEPAPATATTVKAAGAPDPAAAAAAPGTEGAVSPASPEGVQKMLNDTTDALVKKALESLNSDPKVAETIQQVVLQKVNEALGNKLVPTPVAGTLPNVPGTVVARPGQDVINKAAVPAELQDMVEVSSD